LELAKQNKIDQIFVLLHSMGTAEVAAVDCSDMVLDNNDSQTSSASMTKLLPKTLKRGLSMANMRGSVSAAPNVNSN
jgi:hypothetical protein